MHENRYSELPFETQVFGQPVWRLDDISYAYDVVRLAEEQNVGLISYREKGSENDFSLLDQSGFYPVEILTTLERAVTPEVEWPIHIRIADKDDAACVAEIARNCFEHDRYHADKAIDDKIADEIKAVWMFNSVSGRADAVFLYEKDQEILGFNACMLRDGNAVIDLIGVRRDAQGGGIGRDLVRAMDSYYFNKAKNLRLGTQEMNKKSQNFYRTLGFKDVARYQTWHWTSF
ncbi:GNAT family N-acetyltransferase [Curvivirga aplysinae]|uniref:GNAT family N-acetyltransferase n=1 Tax=Curvivirga aplysinae TaxID=2529852 RepID=UPI0012BC8E09|nr:GNAT family N-acetyltransferase [Curvivirga aplysinae]MTI10577.1 GNAT family N-acetyltransferase [Curvivirga aplysinae]